MVRTRVGYTGGEMIGPTYEAMGDHTEALQIDFDPAVVSLEEMVERFWRSHSPIVSMRSLQYRSAIWYADEHQRKVINDAKQKIAKDYSAPIQTAVLPLGPFYRAEDYHQKYSLQRHGKLMKVFAKIYPEFRHFVDSTAAARLNGNVLGSANKMVDQDWQQYGILADEMRRNAGVKNALKR